MPGMGNISSVDTFGVSSASLEEGTESEDELIPFMEKTGLKNEFCSVLEPVSYTHLTLPTIYSV